MKKVLLIVCVLIVILLLVACNLTMQSNNQSEKQKTDSDPIANTKNATEGESLLEEQQLYFPAPNERSGGYMADFIDGAFSSTVQGLFDRSDIVILANVINENQWISEPSELENAESEVTVSKVYKGNIKEDDKVTVLETGYRFDDHDLSFGGEPILRKGMKVLLFLTKEDEETSTRGIVGCFQGKVFLDSNDVCYPYSYYTEYDREHYGNTITCPFFEDFKEPMPLSDLESMMKQ